MRYRRGFPAFTSLALIFTACGGIAARGDGGTDAIAMDGRLADALPDGLRDAAGDASGSMPHATTLTPTASGLDTGDLANPLRGQYRWLGVAPNPSGWAENDSYQRWNWIDFESSRGNYNFAMIDSELAAARARHGRFGMRLMALCQGCATHMYMGARSSIPDDLASSANSLIGAPPGSPTELYVLPDWNGDTYLTRLTEVITAIADHYRDDPTFAFVDVTGYGNWGEFHLWPFNTPGGPYDTSTQRPISDATARRIVQINAHAFANKLLVLNSENHAATAEAVATTSPRIGFRVDCLGADGLGGGDSSIMAVAGAMDHWRVAPFITEWCQYNIGSSGADLFVQGEMQVRTFHVSMLSSGNFTNDPTPGAEATAFRAANIEAGYRLRVANLTVHSDPATPTMLGIDTTWNDDGVAPTYLAWRVTFGLRGPANIEAPLTIDLGQTMPDRPLTTTQSVTVAALTPGHYEAYLRVDDVQAISPPMFLAMQGRDADGNYVLGSLDLP